MKLITIKKAKNPSELAILKSRLESEGINCYLKSELAAQVISHLPIYAELQIMENDLPSARQILMEIGEFENVVLEIRCPKCDSDKSLLIKDFSVKKIWKDITLVISALIAVSPEVNLYNSNNYKCNSCGHKFVLKST
jgi:transposase-like protein